MKKSLKFLLPIFMAISLSACGNSDSEIVLNTVTMLGGDNPTAECYQELIKNYENKYKISVSDESEGSSEEWKSSVITDFQIGNEPDVLFYYTGSEASTILKNNQIVDVSTIQAEYPEYGKNLSESAMEFMVEDDGKTYALPIRGFWEGLYVNEVLFKEYDLELPTTKETFVKAIKTFAETDIAPIAISLNDEPHYWVEHLILSYGGIEEHCKVLNPGEPVPTSWVDGLNLFQELNEIGAFSESAFTNTVDEAKQLFKDDRAAMILEGSWYSSGIPDQENTTVVPFPSYNDSIESTDIIGGFSYGFYITQKAWEDPEKREAAVNFVMEMTTDESIKKFAIAGGGAPAADIQVNDELTKVQADGVNMSATATNIEMPIDSRINKNSWEYIISNVVNIVNGNVDSESVLEKAANLNN